MSKVLRVFKKDPEEVLDYSIDWSGILASGEIIDTSTWAIDSTQSTPTLEIDEGLTSNDDTSATVWVSGGTHRIVYALINTVTTDQTRTYERVIKIHCENSQT